MQVEFIVDWGYRHIYFTEKFLPRLCFDGGITVSHGQLIDCKRVAFQEDRFGCHVLSPLFSDYGKKEWTSTVCNGYDGFLFCIEGDENTAVAIETVSATAKFTIGELLKNEHLVFDTENPFLFAVMHVYLKDHEWYLAKQKAGEIRLKGKEFDGRQNSFFGVNGVVVPCGERVKSSFDFSAEENADEEVKVEGAIRVIQSQSDVRDEPVNGVADYEIVINGKSVYRNSKFSCNWDDHSQHFEETFFTVPVALLRKNGNAVEIINHDEKKVVLVQMVRFFVEKVQHLQILSCPKWLVKGQVFSVRLYALYPTDLHIECTGGVCVCTPSGETAIRATANNILQCGENEYFFKTTTAGERIEIRFTDKKRGNKSCAVVAEVWDGEREKIEPKTGIEIKLDAPENYEYYFRKLLDGQMGNYVMFRRYGQWNPQIDKVYDIAAKCKKYGIFTDVIAVGHTVKSWLSETIADASGEYGLAVGDHESTGIFYWGEYFHNPAVKTVDEAERLSVKELNEVYNGLKVKGVKVAMGDASGGARYAYQAGFDILRHETCVGHHLTILPDARGAARAYNKPIWGAHIASQHNFQAELETGIGRYWLETYLPWVFGANFVFEEDSLFQNNKYYRMVNDDYMTLEKQKVTAEFYKHIQTHARLGQPQVDIAFIQGRHQAPFTALSTCNAPMERLYENEDRRIWGKHGASEEEWGHRQPEKGMHLLEVVAPQIYLAPLNQDPYKTRKLFSANPYGEWDFLPIEAPQEIYAQYKILFMLGWNTMAKQSVGVCDSFENDYQRLKSYAEQGGTIVLAVPQLSQRVDRKLFKDWDNADLYNDGDVYDLFGVRVGKPCEELSESIESMGFPAKDYTEKRELIRRPAKSEEEDGACLLAEVMLGDAEICLIDKKNNRPVLVRKKVGKGYAYLLCVYAYPGHEKLKYITANIMQTLLELHAKKDIFVKDAENQVYWSDWKNGNGGKLYLLNTDWTAIGNNKTVEVVKGDLVFDCTVEERKLLEIAYQAESAVYATTEQVNVVASAENGQAYELYGFGICDLHILSSQNTRVYLDGTEIAKTNGGETVIRVSLSGKSTLNLSENLN
ncbi:MAG: hypothetical protein IJZ32_02395 [Clostridia bacterium]|nr:hypothetical protein [Clostridia bacterium]